MIICHIIVIADSICMIKYQNPETFIYRNSYYAFPALILYGCIIVFRPNYLIWSENKAVFWLTIFVAAFTILNLLVIGF
ncbi:hypothetical protein CORI_0134 [Campylobacter sp. CCUG 57310]|nr:hypothetical protein CORI_0134 [Campylobacter sp. CCUG 57310]